VRFFLHTTPASYISMRWARHSITVPGNGAAECCAPRSAG
jgi:hypothetical protein